MTSPPSSTLAPSPGGPFAWDRRRFRLMLCFFWPLLALGTHWPRLELPVHGLDDLPPDKLIHLGAFGMLATLLIAAGLAGRSASPRRQVLVGALLAGTYSYVDEWTQGLVGRTVAPADLLMNLLAVLAVTATMLRHVDRRSSSTEAGTSWRMGCRLALGLTAPLIAWVLIQPGFNVGSSLVLARWGETVVRGDKLAHLLGSAGVAGLIVGARWLGSHRPALNAWVLLPLLALAGPVVELAQRAIGRAFEVDDIVAHELGVLLVVAALTARWVWRRRGSRRRTTQALAAGDTPPIPDATPRPRGKGTSFVGDARTVSTLTFLSRLTGLVRDSIQARAFGLGGVSDAFTIGFLIPNLFRRLFGEGALTAAFIPIYTDLLKKDRLLATRFASLCVGLLLLVLGAVTLAGEAVMALLLHRYAGTAGGGTENALALRLTMIMLPYMPLVCLVALVGAILQVHGRFGPSASAPVLLNLVMIAATLWATAGVRGEEPLRQVVGIVAWSVLLAGLVQAIWQVAALLAYESFTTRLAGAWVPLRAMLVTMLPTLLALSVFQINTFLDSGLAWVLSPRNSHDATLQLLGMSLNYPIDKGGVAALAWSQRLYQFPLGVFGIAIATAIFPALAHALADGSDQGRTHFREIMRHGLRLTVFIGLPASVGLILVRLPLCRAIFEGGQFTLDDSRRCAAILAGYAPAIWAYSMTHVLTRGFYAVKDPRTPMHVSMGMVALNFVLNLALVWPLAAAGLAWSTAICALVQCVLMLRLIRPRVPDLIDREVVRGWGRTAALSLLMALALAPVTWWFDPAGLTRQQVAVQLAAMVALGGGVFLGGAWLTRAPEIGWLLHRER